MATFEKQTECVVNALFLDLLGDNESECRSLETDSGGQPPAPCDAGSVGRRLACIGDELKTFDAVLIASRLRQMGDRYNVDFERAASEALAEVLKGEMEKFGAAVDSLSRSWIDRNPELVYEKAFLCVSVKLLMYLVKKVPAIALVGPSYLTRAINGNSQVRNYIEAHGGWENLDN